MVNKGWLFGTMAAMNDAPKKCMVCARTAVVLKGGICEPCQERIRREAMGEQSGVADRAERELTHHGITPSKK
jgi:hypothetical protein